MNILVIFNTRCIILVITNERLIILPYISSHIEGSDVEWDGDFIWDFWDLLKTFMSILFLL